MAADGLAEGLAFLQRLTGSREGCFDSRTTRFDVSVICHSSHSLDLAPEERVFLSVQDLRRRETQQLVPVSEACNFKSLDLDATLFLQAMAGRSERSAVADSRDMRVCGEIRIPLHRLVHQCKGMLYHTWLTLDSPGLLDSVASIGFGDDGAEFDKRLIDGPRQVFQPKICVTICRTADLDSSGRLVMTRDTPPEVRAVQWAPLLLSQQQHAILSAALHWQRSQASDQKGVERQAKLEQQIEGLCDRLKSQAAKVLEMKAHLQGQGECRPAGAAQATGFETLCMNGSSNLGNSIDVLQAEVARQSQAILDLRSQAPRRDEKPSIASEQLEKMRGSNARREAEIICLRGELNKVKEEAARKVAASTERIQNIRREHQEALQEGERLRNDAKHIRLQCEELDKERHRLSEQKEALLRIVEDLHQACSTAGLQPLERASIDNNVTMNFGLS